MGHAVVGALLPDYDSVTMVSIVPRGAAGGLTFFAPSEERLESGLYSRSYLENQMAVAMGGRIAEELIFGADNVPQGPAATSCRSRARPSRWSRRWASATSSGRWPTGGRGALFPGAADGEVLGLLQDGRPHRR